MRKSLALSILCFLIMSSGYALCAENVRLKMVAANPSETESRTVTVRQALPKGISPGDIADAGGFSVGYDLQKSLYYISQDVNLNPKETVTLGIEMRDIWLIPDTELSSLKKQALDIAASLKGTEYADQAGILSASICGRLDSISKSQQILMPDIEARIVAYERNSAVLKEAEKDIGSLEELAGSLGITLKSGFMGDGPVKEKAVLRPPRPAAPEDISGTVKFSIEAVNPFAQNRQVPLKYYLPAELRPEYVVDNGSLEIKYDYENSAYYAFSPGVELEPNGRKAFTVEVKDVWVIPAKELDSLKERVKKMSAAMEKSEFSAAIASLIRKIDANLEDIAASQSAANVSVERHIGDYRSNLVKFEDAKRYLSRIERMTAQELGPGGYAALSEGSTESAARISREGSLKRGARGMELVGKSIFAGKAPAVSTTWKIIWSIIAFLGLISALFFVIWWAQLRKK